MVVPLILSNAVRTLVQTASVWPTSDLGWTSIDPWAQSASFGLNNDCGSASLFTPSGTAFKPGKSISSLIKSQSICGKYVRILRRNVSGTVVADDGLNFSPLWHGIVTGRKIAPDAGATAFTNSYSCAGIMSVLDSVTPQYHLYEAGAGDVAADVGSSPIFNYLGSKKTGNRSANLYNFGGGVLSYVFSKSPGATFWTASDVVTYYLALFKYFGGGGPTFSLAGQLTALSWQEKWDLNGHSCGEALARVMSQKQGIGYRCDVVGTQPVITVKSLSRAAITVPATPFTPSFTLPANDEQTILNLTTPDHIHSFDLSEDASATVDELGMVIGRTWYAVTLSLFDVFDQDWTAQNHTDWLAYDPLNTYGTLNTNFGIARVFRRFKMKDSWNGATIGGFVLPTSRTMLTSGLHGDQGFDGGSANGAPTTRPPGRFFTMTSELPCLDGYDWSTVDPATVDKTRRNAPAIAFIRNGDGTWSTLAEACTNSLSTMSIDVDGDLGALTFPEAAVEAIEAAIAEGSPIYVTVGMYGQFNDMVSWRRALINRVRDQTRVFNKSRPTLMRKIIPSGTIVGVSNVGTLQIAPAVVIHDDVPLAANLLAISRTWFAESAWSISYTRAGEIDPTYAKPGSMLTEVDHFEGDGSITLQAVLGVVTSVTYDFAEPGATKVSTKRIPIDVEAVI